MFAFEIGLFDLQRAFSYSTCNGLIDLIKRGLGGGRGRGGGIKKRVTESILLFYLQRPVRFHAIGLRGDAVERASDCDSKWDGHNLWQKQKERKKL